MSLKTLKEEIVENDDPEITEEDFENMYISQGKNETDKMERRFNIWLENRDDDFKLDIWDFRCLQDFIFKEIKLSLDRQRDEIVSEIRKKIEDLNERNDILHEDLDKILESLLTS